MKEGREDEGGRRGREGRGGREQKKGETRREETGEQREKGKKTKYMYMYIVHVYMYIKKLHWWGQTSQRSLDSGCFKLVSSHQQGMCITCLAHHLALLYTS